MSMNFMYPFDTQQQFNNLSLNNSQQQQQTQGQGQQAQVQGQQIHGSDHMRLEFQIKETQIETLEQEIKTLKNLLESQQNSNNLGTIIIPNNIEEIFKSLADSLEKKDEELKESKNLSLIHI